MKFLIGLILFCMTVETKAQKISRRYTLKLEKIAQLPSSVDNKPNLGIAGPVAGVVGDVILVGGGANFPELPPWAGGTKKYHTQIYVLSKKKSGKYKWCSPKGSKLPEPIAYPSNVNIKGGFLSIGGENDNGQLKSVYHYQLKNDSISITSFPDLPQPITSSGATCIGNHVYVIGGISGENALNSIFVMDIKATDKKWVELAKMPMSLSNAIVIAQMGEHEEKIFVLGGRYKNLGDRLTTYSDKIFIYTPSSNTWVEQDFLSVDGQKMKLAAGTGVSYISNEILLIGGDQGQIYNQIEDYNNQIANPEVLDKEYIKQEKEKLITSHPGFYRKIFSFNVITGLCSEIGQISGMPQVTTSAFYWKKSIIIPSGEIKPGVRTPDIMKVKIQK